MPDLNAELQIAAFIALALTGGFWMLGRLLRRLEKRHLPPSSLESIRLEPRRPDMALRVLEWRSQLPQQTLPRLLASLSFGVFTIAGLLIGDTEPWMLIFTLVLVAALHLDVARAFMSKTWMRSDRRSLSVKGGGLEKTWSWYDIRAVGLNGELTLLRVFEYQGFVDVNLRPFSANDRLEIARGMREHMDAHLLETQQISDVPPAEGGVGLRHAGEVVHVVLLLVGVLVATNLDVRGEPNILGLRCTYSSHYLQEQFGLPDQNGCVVLRVSPESAAARAGFHQGDLIVRLDDIPITSGDQFSAVFRDSKNRDQTYRVVRSGQGEIEIKVSLSYAGRAPIEDEDNPYYYYLRARTTSSGRSDLILRDYDRVLELAPAFDLAYAYRGVFNASVLAFDSDPQQALADFDKAISLDPNAEVYRLRAQAHYGAGRMALAREDIETAIELDECETAFRGFNFDCYENYLRLSLIDAVESDFAASALAARTAIEFYSAEPSAYLQASRQYWLIEDYASGREYAAHYLALVGDGGDEINKHWARSILEEKPEEGELAQQDPSDRPPSIFIEERPRGWTSDPGIPGDDARITHVRLTSARTLERPAGQTAFSAKEGQVWLYFEFAQAEDATAVSFEWFHDSGVEYGHALLRGAAEGTGWAPLTNFLPGESSEGRLTLAIMSPSNGSVNEDTQYVTVRFVAEPSLGAGTFFEDPEATRPALFYDGSQPVYLSVPYTNAVLSTELAWQAEVNSVPVGEGGIVLDHATGNVMIEFVPESPLPPGVLKVYVQLGVERRTAWLAVVEPEVAAARPFAAFVSAISPALTYETKDFATTDQSGWVLRDFDPSGLEGNLRVQWYFFDRPSGFDEFTAAELEAWTPTSIDGILPSMEDIGEYGVLVFLGERLLHADLIVIHPPGHF